MKSADSNSSESNEDTLALPNPQAEIEEFKNLNLKDLLKDMMREWNLSDADFSNSESVIQYHAYIEGLENFIKNKSNNNNIDLKQNKDIKRLKMTITNLH